MQKFLNVINNYLGKELDQYIKPLIHKADYKEICIVKIAKSITKVILKNKDK